MTLHFRHWTGTQTEPTAAKKNKTKQNVCVELINHTFIETFIDNTKKIYTYIHTHIHTGLTSWEEVHR